MLSRRARDVGLVSVMRLIHFSDTHLGFSESSRVDPGTGVNLRELDV
jgi:hypothetical protein